MRETTPELTDAIHKDSNKTRRKNGLLRPVVITYITFMVINRIWSIRVFHLDLLLLHSNFLFKIFILLWLRIVTLHRHCNGKSMAFKLS